MLLQNETIMTLSFTNLRRILYTKYIYSLIFCRIHFGDDLRWNFFCNWSFIRQTLQLSFSYALQWNSYTQKMFSLMIYSNSLQFLNWVAYLHNLLSSCSCLWRSILLKRVSWNCLNSPIFKVTGAENNACPFHIK